MFIRWTLVLSLDPCLSMRRSILFDNICLQCESGFLECSIIGSHEFMFFSVLKHFYFLFFKSRSPLFSLAKSETNFSFSLSAKKSSLSEIKKMTQDWWLIHLFDGETEKLTIGEKDKGPIWMENSTEVKRSNNQVEVEWTCPDRLGRTAARYESVRSRSNKCWTCRISSSKPRLWTWRRSNQNNMILMNSTEPGGRC